MTFEEAVGSLKAHEEKLKGHTEKSTGQLLLTEEEWLRREASDSKLFLKREEWLKKSNKNGGEGSSNLRSRALLLVERKKEIMLISENDVMPKLKVEDKANEESNLWYLDNGASNHMTGYRAKFREPDESITGQVKFGDGSVVDIKEKGTVVFKCKNRKELVFNETRKPFQNEASFRASQPLELIHADLCGPISPTTKGGNNYFMLLVDDYSRVMWAYMLTSKDEALEVFKKFRILVEKDREEQIKMLRTDRGDEFCSKQFIAYCEESRIVRQYTAPYTPQQNEVVERQNRTVMAMARSFLKEMKLPVNLWGEAIRHSQLANGNDISIWLFSISNVRVTDAKTEDASVEPVKPLQDRNSSGDSNNTGDFSMSTESTDMGEMSRQSGTSSSTSGCSTKPKKYRQLSEIYEETQEVEADNELLLAGIDEAVKEKLWKDAMQQEIDAIEKNNTWKLVDLLPAGKNVWEVHHLDVKSLFLNGDLEEVVFVKQPEGFVKENEEHKVYQLIKALSGLRQAPRAWTSTACIRMFKNQMSVEFDMSDLGKLTHYLGIEVDQRKGYTQLKQTGYAKRLLERAGHADCNPAKFPMEPRQQNGKDKKGKAVDSTMFKSIVGRLRYLVHTRPYIAYSVGVISRFMKHPTVLHFGAARRILRYVKGTLHFGLRYTQGAGDYLLSGFSDSDLGGNVKDRRSTGGMAFYLDESLITWVSQKERCVALSSCEAEFMAATAAACQAVWLRNLLMELTDTKHGPIVLFVDNKSGCSRDFWQEKSTADEVGSSTKRVALELFPTHPKQNELNIQSFASLVNRGLDDDTNMQSVPQETQEDPFDRLFKSEYEKMKETCKHYLNNKCSDLLKQAEEQASPICREKDMKIAHMKSTISSIQEQLASQNEVLNNRNIELDNSRRRSIELEKQVANNKSQAEFWKEKVQRTEEMLANATVCRQRQAPCCCEEEETASSSVGETKE
ncbi:hypothetical protein AgCh_037150 [Apium graveolens]